MYQTRRSFSQTVRGQLLGHGREKRPYLHGLAQTKPVQHLDNYIDMIMIVGSKTRLQLVGFYGWGFLR